MQAYANFVRRRSSAPFPSEPAPIFLMVVLVPEPGSATLLLGGLALLAARRRASA